MKGYCVCRWRLRPGKMVGAVQHQTARARQSLVGPEGSMATG